MPRTQTNFSTITALCCCVQIVRLAPFILCFLCLCPLQGTWVPGTVRRANSLLRTVLHLSCILSLGWGNVTATRRFFFVGKRRQRVKILGFNVPFCYGLDPTPPTVCKQHVIRPQRRLEVLDARWHGPKLGDTFLTRHLQILLQRTLFAAPMFMLFAFRFSET